MVSPRPSRLLIACNWCSTLCALSFSVFLLVPSVPWGVAVYSGDGNDFMVELRLSRRCTITCVQAGASCDYTTHCVELPAHYSKQLVPVRNTTIAAVAFGALLVVATVFVSFASPGSMGRMQLGVTALSCVFCVLILTACFVFIKTPAWKDFVQTSNAHSTSDSVVTVPTGAAVCGWNAMWLLLLFIFSASWRNCCLTRDTLHPDLHRPLVEHPWMPPPPDLPHDHPQYAELPSVGRTSPAEELFAIDKQETRGPPPPTLFL